MPKLANARAKKFVDYTQMRLLILCFVFILSCASLEGKNKPVEGTDSIMDTTDIPLSSEEAASSSSVVYADLAGDLLTDNRDGKTYKVVVIKAQTWMAENLNYNTSKSKCYDGYESNCERYGRLYTWEEAQTVCPGGWRLPSNSRWETLVDYAGGKEKAGKKLKAKSSWNNFDGKSGNGTDDYGFSALAGGHGDYEGNFSYMGDLSIWWSDNAGLYSEFASSWFMNSRGNSRGNDFFGVFESYYSYVRCVKD